MVVLDAVHRIQAQQAPDLAVRWNCKAGKCGSCSAEINGMPKLMCMTRLSDLNLDMPVILEPMHTFPVIRDLVTDVSWNFRVKKTIKQFRPRPPDAPDGTWRMQPGRCRARAGVSQVYRVLPLPGRVPRSAGAPQAARVYRPAFPRPCRGARNASARYRRPRDRFDGANTTSAIATSRLAAGKCVRSRSPLPKTPSFRSRSGWWTAFSILSSNCFISSEWRFYVHAQTYFSR